MAAHRRRAHGRRALAAAGALGSVLLLAACSGDGAASDDPSTSAPSAPDASSSAGPTSEPTADPTAVPSVDVEALRSRRPTTGPAAAAVTWEAVPSTSGADRSVVDAVQAFAAQEARVLAADDASVPGREWAAFATGRELARRWEDVAEQRVARTTGPIWHRSLAPVEQVAPDRWSWRTCADVGQRRSGAAGAASSVPRAERAFDVTYEVVRESVDGADVYRVEDLRAKGAVPPLDDAAERTCYAWAVHDGSDAG